MSALSTALRKKLAKKGKVGTKLLRKLAVKKLGLSDKDLSPAVVRELQQQVRASVHGPVHASLHAWCRCHCCCASTHHPCRI